MGFVIKGRLKNDKEVRDAFSRAPKIYFGELRDWLRNERANVLGGKDADGKHRRGLRDFLSDKKLRRRGGSWSKKVTHLFKGSIPFSKNLNKMKLTMGILGTGRHQLKLALEKQQTGGTITSSKQMPVPIYRNLKDIGYTGPWSVGNVHGRMRSKAFRYIRRFHGLVPIRDGSRTLYFDPESKRKRGDGFKKSGLLFLGLHGVRIKKSLTGRLDLLARFDKMQPAIMSHGRTAVDRATRKVQKKFS